MNILVIHNSQNAHGHDAEGAFIPEAVLFERHHKALGNTVERVPFQNNLHPPLRIRAFLKAIADAKPFDAFVYLGHGLKNGLPSAGLTNRDIPQLVTALLSKAKDPKKLIITLYACSTAGAPGANRNANDGEGGFADRLRDALAAKGMTEGWIDGHTLPAHATTNPYTRRFPMDAPTINGGEWIVEPKTALWKRWEERLHAKAAVDPFRFDFPYMTIEQIHAACGG